MNKLYVIKYGGNAMVDQTGREELISKICQLREYGKHIILVHGGGPYIREALEAAGIESAFIGGQRVTTKEAMRHVEMALKGKVNAHLVGRFNALGQPAVGLSGKDGGIVTAKKRYGIKIKNGREEKIDLGQVGDVAQIDPHLLNLLLDNGYLPVITCIASDENGNDYNINGDVFAGHIAGAMQAEEFIVLTDVNGLMEDIADADSLISEVTVPEIDHLISRGVISGGMLPKIEACRTAIEHGTKKVRIINGMKPDQLMDSVKGKKVGTIIRK